MKKLPLVGLVGFFAFSAALTNAQSQPSSTNSSPVASPNPVQVAVPVLLGTFHDGAYVNDYFGIYYPLSRDWVRETNLVRSKIAAERNRRGTYVLLAAVHIPHTHASLRADSSFNVLAVSRPGASAQDCKQSLEAMGSELESRKEGGQKGDLTQLTIAGHDFYRGDFEYRLGTNHVTTLCTPVKDYLLRWNIAGWSKQAIEIAVSTLNSMTPAPPPNLPPAAAVDTDHPKRVHVAAGVSTGLLIKKVQPIYPPEAMGARIEGTVRLMAVINKAGDVVDLEVVDGPLELVVSAVDAVRQWKYRPYLMDGAPVDVQTEVVVNYSIRY
jgi:TonB family protein